MGVRPSLVSADAAPLPVAADAGGRPHSTDLSISPDGNHWVYSNQHENNGKTVQFRTINEFRNPDYIEWWSEYSTDGGSHWIKMGGGSEKRQK